MRRWPIVSASILAVLLAACAPNAPKPAPVVAELTPPPLIPRSVVFGNPGRNAGTISPDGKWIGYVAPDEGVLNIWVAPVDEPDQAKAITHDRKRGIRAFQFAYDNRHVLFSQDEGGNENFHVYAADIRSGTQKDLTPFDKSRAEVASLSAKHPGVALITANNRNPQYFDLYRVDIASGKRTRIEKNDGYDGYVADADFRTRIAIKPTPSGGFEWFKRKNGRWVAWSKVGQADALGTRLLGFTNDGKTLYVLDSRDRDTAALFAIDWRSGQRTLLAEDARADVGAVLTDPATGVVRAASINYLRGEWKALDPSLEKDLQALKSIGDGEFEVVGSALDDSRWVVLFIPSDGSARYYFYDRESGSTNVWFETRPDLANYTLAPMHSEQIRSRDGLTLVSYLTLPVASDPMKSGKPGKPVPLVLFVHGGPWGRDEWGLNGYHQWLANRGYAVLSVNFRGSTGLGKAFTNAGDHEWGGKMHDDLIDAVDWAVAQGITSKDKVAIMGGSYGGYATLAGLAMTPDAFACGVDIVGPSNLITLLGSIPPYWASFRAQLTTRMGDPATEAGRTLLTERSPLTYADQIRKPLLIGQGKNDPRVNVAESEQIVKALQDRNIPVTYVLYPDEGHGFRRPQNSTSFNAVAESFLGRCLSGRVEPIGEDFAGSSITIPVGASLLPGVAEALGAKTR